jgi:long-chain acyl-CoA synthetase
VNVGLGTPPVRCARSKPRRARSQREGGWGCWTAWGQVLPEAARCFGDKTALVCDGGNVTFRELDAPSARLARSRGVSAFARATGVTLYSGNRWEWIVSYYASARVDAVITPINAMLTQRRSCISCRTVQASDLIASPDKGLPIILAGSSPLREIILFGNEVLADARSFDALLEAAGGRRDARGFGRRRCRQQASRS